jgi:hypothetical protein
MPAVGILSNFRTRVENKVGQVDSPKLDPSNDILDLCIEAGLNQYTRLRPRKVVEEIAGTGSQKRYVLDTELGNWESGFSAIAKVVSVQNRNTDDEIEEEFSSFDVRRNIDDEDVLFLPEATSATEHVRIQYTANHVIDEETVGNTTVPDIDTDFLTAICASYVAYWIARKASDLSNTSLGSSETSYWRLRQHWAERAKELMREASEYIDPKMVSHESAGVAQEWKSESRIAPRRISH